MSAGFEQFHNLEKLKTLPPGTIIQWYGLASEIPAGWLLCDGRFGTPDFRAKFEYPSDMENGWTKAIFFLMYQPGSEPAKPAPPIEGVADIKVDRDLATEVAPTPTRMWETQPKISSNGSPDGALPGPADAVESETAETPSSSPTVPEKQTHESDGLDALAMAKELLGTEVVFKSRFRKESASILTAAHQSDRNDVVLEPLIEGLESVWQVRSVEDEACEITNVLRGFQVSWTQRLAGAALSPSAAVVTSLRSAEVEPADDLGHWRILAKNDGSYLLQNLALANAGLASLLSVKSAPCSQDLIFTSDPNAQAASWDCEESPGSFGEPLEDEDER